MGGDEMFTKLIEGKAMHELRANLSAEAVLTRLSASDLSIFANSKIRPCGLAAFSVFLDRFEVYRRPNESETGAKEEKMFLDETDIALDGDREIFSKKITYRNDGSPTIDNDPIFLWAENQAEEEALVEHFMVWYRGATSSRFRNLWARIHGGLPKGTYSLMFRNHSDIWAAWGVNKKVVLTTTTVFGANNEIIGFAFILTGVAILSVGVAFSVLGDSEGHVDSAPHLSPQTKEALLLIARQKHQKRKSTTLQKDVNYYVPEGYRLAEVTRGAYKVYPENELR